MKNILLCLGIVICFLGMTAEKILKYDPNTVHSFSGTIVKVDQEHWYGKKENLIFVVAPEGNLPSVLVDGGLSTLYKKKPEPGNKIEITGSFVKTENQEIVLSRSVKLDGKTIKVRLKNGVPTWIANGKKGKGHRSFIYRRMRRGRH